MQQASLPSSGFHYTTLSAAVQILQTRQLWASDARYLNDAQEIKYGISLLRELMGELGSSNLSVQEEEINNVEQAVNDPVALGSEPYVISFTSRADDLGMWRSYGGGGCAIEFDFSILECLCSRERVESLSNHRLTEKEFKEMNAHNLLLTSELRRVVYGKDAGKRFLGGWISGPKEGGGSARMWDPLIAYSAFVKDEAFVSEDEVRLLIQAPGSMNSKVLVREARGHLIPYRTLIFPPVAVKSITVGPGPYSERTRSALKRFLYSGRGEWYDVAINVSSAPYLP